jgi:exopolysaccharide biosynthesis WecB/TagA/CpsF family protein
MHHISKKIEFLGIHVSAPANKKKISEVLISDDSIVTFVNPQIFFALKKDKSLKEIFNRFDYVFCDGIGMIVGLKLLGFNNIERLSFDSTSVAPLLFDHCQENNKKILLIGGKIGVSLQAKKTIKQKYPELNIVGAFSGYGDDIKQAIDEIFKKNVEVVICGMGIMHQERFFIKLKKMHWKGSGFTCGGYFDQLNEGFKYYSPLIDKLNIRFLYRLYKEPRRLIKRYVINYSHYIFLLIKKIIHH